MANMRRRRYHRVPESVSETITPKGVFISNEYKDRILFGFIFTAFLLVAQAFFAGFLFGKKK